MTVQNQIIQDITDNEILLYMKGELGNSPCGYSTRLVLILNHIGVAFETRNVLESDELRRAVKEHAGVRTLPLLFVKGKYIGGSDEVRQMHEAGTLVGFFESIGIPTTLDPSKEPLIVGDISREQTIACSKAS